MVARALRFFASGPDRPLFSEDPAVIRRVYERWRWSVFLSVTLGYGMYYVCRVNFGLVKKLMIDEGVLTASQMGYAGSALLGVYALGRCANGFLADRANIRRFMSAALLCSALVNLVLGWNGSFWPFLVLWGINGWFQSVGSAPSIASLSHWFTPRERSTRYGIWCCSHGIGEGLTNIGTAALVSVAGWHWGFWGPGLVCLATAAVLSRTLADRPQARGLPPVHLYKGLPPPAERPDAGLGMLQLEVVKNPAIWILGAASACAFAARYGMNNWGVLYLQEAKGYSLVEAGATLAISPGAQMVGSILSGFVSARFFAGRHNVPALVAGLVAMGALAGLWLNPPGHQWVDAAAMACFGVALGALLVYLGGLMAVDICSHRAAGAAMGVVGLVSYLGAAAQETVSGVLIDAGKRVVDGKTIHVFDSAIAVWLGALALSTVLAATVWKARRRVSPEAQEAPGA